MRGRILPYGAEAVLVEVDGLPEVLGLKVALDALFGANPEARAEWGVLDTVPGARTLLVTADRTAVPRLVERLRDLLAVACTRDLSASVRTVVVPVTYDGPDLAEVAGLTGLSVTDVVQAHTATAWTCGFTGFAPGFGYLVGGDPRLAVPRRATPRTEVPSGSVALAGGYSAIYPRTGPGGWQLIGRTDLPIWDQSDVTAPALLAPGVTVRFEAVG